MKRFKTTTLMLILTCFCLTQALAHKENKVLMLLSADQHGYWTGEVIDAYNVFKKENVEVIFATPDGSKGVPDGMFALDAKGEEDYKKLADQLASPLSLKELKYSDFDAIYIPGGSGPMFDLYNHPTVNTFIKNIYQSNKPVAAVCHGPAALAGVRLDNGELLIKNKKVTGKSNAEEGEWARKNYAFMLEDKLKSAGGIFSSAAPGKPWVAQDGLLLTGQNPASSTLLAEQLIVTLNKK